MSEGDEDAAAPRTVQPGHASRQTCGAEVRAREGVNWRNVSLDRARHKPRAIFSRSAAQSTGEWGAKIEPIRDQSDSCSGESAVLVASCIRPAGRGWSTFRDRNLAQASLTGTAEGDFLGAVGRAVGHAHVGASCSGRGRFEFDTDGAGRVSGNTGAAGIRLRKVSTIGPSHRNRADAKRTAHIVGQS
jgi:hypothetical protein